MLELNVSRCWNLMRAVAKMVTVGWLEVETSTSRGYIACALGLQLGLKVTICVLCSLQRQSPMSDNVAWVAAIHAVDYSE